MWKTRVAYPFLLAGAVAFYVLYSDTLSLITLFSVIILPVVLFVLLCVQWIGVSAQVDRQVVTSSVNRGEEIQFSITVRNRTILPIPQLTAELVYVNSFWGLEEREKIMLSSCPLSVQTIHCTLISQHSGVVYFSLKNLRLSDYLQLFSLKKKLKGQSLQKERYLILPQIHMLEAGLTQPAIVVEDSGVFSKTHPGDDPSEVFDMREYTDGDKMNRIHWKISARHPQESLIVKEYSDPVSSSVFLLLDLAPPKEDFLTICDGLLETSLSLSYFLMQQEAIHDLGCLAQSGYDIQRICTESDWETLEMRLLELRPVRERKKQTFALSLNLKLMGDKPCGHLIYITANVSREICQALAECEQTHRITVLWVTTLAAEEILQEVVLPGEHMEILVVSPGQIKASLMGFVL